MQRLSSHIRYLIYLFVLLLLAWLIWSTLGPSSGKKQAESSNTSSATNLPESIAIESGLSCAEAVSPANAFFAYEQVRTELNNEKSVEDIEYIDCFIDLADTPNDPIIALQEFTRSAFNSDVFYSYLKSQFDRSTVKNKETGEPEGIRAWNAYAFGAAALVAFDKTGERLFLELYIEYFEQLFELRDTILGKHDDFHDKKMNSWGSNNIDERKWISHVTIFSVVMLPATEFARRINENSELSEFSDFADQVVNYFNAAYSEFDSDQKPIPESDEFWYWRPLEEKFEATNHLHLQGQVLLNMYAMTGDDTHRERIEDIIQVFERGVEVDDQGLAAWNYHPYFQVKHAMKSPNAREKSEPTWKAGNTVPFLYQAHSDGFKIDPVVLNAVTKTIVEHVLADNNYAITFHPDNGLSDPARNQMWLFERHKSKTPSIVRYLAASSENRLVPELIRETVSTRQDLFPGGWFKSIVSARGYAFFLDSTVEAR